MKKNYFLLILSLFCMTLSAKNDGKKILDEAAKRIERYGDVCVEFKATAFNGTEEQGRMEGKMLLQGMKYQLNTPDLITWYNGTTQWTLVPDNKEVNVTEPTIAEIQSVHPYSFLSLYKNGYDIEARESKLRGQDVYEVHLMAKKKNASLQEIYVDVRKSDYALFCIRVRQGKTWNRISLETIQGGLKFSEADFTFKKEQYPDYEIIDLR